MPIDFGTTAARDRDAKLRRQMLEMLNIARGFAPSGGLSGPRLFSEASANLPADMNFEDDGHFIRLCRDLRNLELVTWTDLTRRRGELYGPRHFQLAITAKGTQLIEEAIPPIAGIDDERVVGGQA